MDEPKIHEIKQWILKADHDFVSAERLLDGDPPLRDTAVYHCQQAAEKILKAYLTLRDAPFQKVHTLSVLIDQCEKLDQSFQKSGHQQTSLLPMQLRSVIQVTCWSLSLLTLMKRFSLQERSSILLRRKCLLIWAVSLFLVSLAFVKKS